MTRLRHSFFTFFAAVSIATLSCADPTEPAALSAPLNPSDGLFDDLLRPTGLLTCTPLAADSVTQLIGPGRVPVIAPLALSTENEALNVDGDRVAARVAAAIDADALLILTNVPGLLRDIDDPSSLVAETTLDEAETLAQGRMKKKILAAREALEAGVDEVVIRSATGDPTVRTVIRA